jgi:hypothetical protein
LPKKKKKERKKKRRRRRKEKKNLQLAKAVPLHATKALGGEEVQLLLILDLGTTWG